VQPSELGVGVCLVLAVRPVGEQVQGLAEVSQRAVALCLEAGAVGVAVVRASTDAAAVRTALERAAV